MKFLNKDLRVQLLDDSGNVLWEAHHGGNPVVYTSPDGMEFGYDPTNDTGYVKREMVDVVDDLGIVTKRPVTQHVHYGKDGGVIDSFDGSDGSPMDAGFTWSKPSIQQRRLAEAGLREEENVLVCETWADEAEGAGEVSANCRDCGIAVGIPRRWVTLWGRRDEEPPAVVCRSCYGDQHSPNFSLDAFQVQDSVTFEVSLEQYKKTLGNLKDSWAHWEVSSRDYARKTVDAFKSFQEGAAAIEERISTCSQCGAMIHDGSGRKTCQGCQRKQWRRT